MTFHRAVRNREALTLDQQGKTLAPIPPKIDLSDANAIRREMATVYRDMRRGNIETQDGTRLVYVLDALRKCFETSVLQQRLEVLERTLEYRRKQS